MNNRWTDNDVTALCEVCINFIHRNGRGQTFKWHDIHKELEEKTGRKFQFKSVKNKFDAMRADWYMWKFLKNGETGLGWDPVTGRISASDDWWKKKIAVKLEAKKFRNKPLHPSMEDLYFQIFEGKRATEEGVVAPSIDPSSANLASVENGKVNEEGGGDDAYEEFIQYSSRLDDLESQEQSFYGDFMKEVNSQTQDKDINFERPQNMPNTSASDTQTTRDLGKSAHTNSTQSQNTSATKTIKPMQMKRKRRQSTGSAVLSSQISNMVNSCNCALEILESDVNPRTSGDTAQGASNNPQVGARDSSVGLGMDVVNRMVNEFRLEKGSELWCFLIHLLEDNVRRELFLKIDDDDGRMAWLDFMHRRDK